MAIYAASQTCSEQVMILVNPRFAVNHTPQCRRRLLGRYIIGAQIVSASLRKARVFKDRQNLSPYNILYER